MDTKGLIHKVTVTGSVVTFKDKEVSLDVALEIARLANLNLAGAVIGNESGLSGNVPQTSQSISPAEYLIKYNAKVNTEKILVFSRYIQDVQHQEFLSPKDIRVQFERSREPMPGNFTRDLSRVLNYGWLGESNIKPGHFYVTSLGVKTMDEHFSKNFSRAIRSKGGGKLAPTVIGEQIKKLNMEPNDDEFPSYFSVNSKIYRMLWLVAKAKKLGVDKLNQKEVCFLAEKVGGDLPRKSVSSYAEGLRKKGYLTTPLESGTRYLRILEEGNQYLRSLKKMMVG